MSCDEIEALRLGLMNCLGTTDDAVRRHAEQELGDALDGDTPIAALAAADSLAELRRHLDAALVDLKRSRPSTRTTRSTGTPEGDSWPFGTPSGRWLGSPTPASRSSTTSGTRTTRSTRCSRSRSESGSHGRFQ